MDKVEREVDPEGKLTIQERAKRAEWARNATCNGSRSSRRRPGSDVS
jgi:hypothetical protein